MHTILNITDPIVDFLWGIPAIVLLLGTGLYLSYRTRFIQVRGFLPACKLLFNNKQPNATGEVSPFQALAISLAGTVGVGNIAGVAAAIGVGGPGAVFWMWMTAILGMATVYSCSALSVKYREKDASGNYVGGPMYVLKNALNMPVLASIFAVCTIIATFGSGNMMPANMMFEGLEYILPQSSNYKLLLAFVASAMVALVIIGGVKRIGKIMGRIIPFMCIAYLIAGSVILLANLSEIPSAFHIIFQQALNPWAAGGGTIVAAIQYGVARGLFSNEAGQGSIPIVHAVAKTNSPKKQGLIAMIGPFIDTIIICTITALVIIIMGAWGEQAPTDIEGVKLAVYAFSQSLGPAGGWIVSVSMILFSFSTIVAWSFYGESALRFLFKSGRGIKTYRIIYSLAVLVGVNLQLNLAWNFADIGMAFMMVPNLIALLLLAKYLEFKNHIKLPSNAQLKRNPQTASYSQRQ